MMVWPAQQLPMLFSTTLRRTPAHQIIPIIVTGDRFAKTDAAARRTTAL